MATLEQIVPPAGGPATDPRPLVDTVQEVRFAVVLYGGVSLAIYINGVAQELLSLVRSTAADPVPAAGGTRRAWLSADRLEGAEPVYREVALEMGRTFRERRARVAGPAAGETLHVAFLVDILSGTSAGGINGVCLAKALANQASMDSLRRLWVSEGDLDKLLNDAPSRAGVPRSRRSGPPASLLNSQRMYFQLKEALDGMDGGPRSRPAHGGGCRTSGSAGCAGRPASALAREMDLFVTATDLEGDLKAVRLPDRTVMERNHRAVFHFVYADCEATGACRSDFEPAMNPLLAFAARSTSSFPLAFEPMALQDILAIEPPLRHAALSQTMDEWKPFFRNLAGRPRDHKTVAFGDGGYLDNKPFGHAIDALAWRRADCLVERKLVYVEPAPEHPELAEELEGKPDAFRNLALAAMELPRAETVREDLERVRRRNDLIERVLRATRTIDGDVELGYERGWTPSWTRAQDEAARAAAWADLWLEDMIRAYGAAYGPYHRLKVSAITTDLAETMTRAAGLDEESQDLEAIRTLVSAWRQSRYALKPNASGVEPEPRRTAPVAPAGAGAPAGGTDGDRRAVGALPGGAGTRLSENRFLLDYDLAYRMRRLAFLRSRIDLLIEGDRLGIEIARTIPGDEAPTTEGAQRWLAEALEPLRQIKQGLDAVHVALRRTGRELRSRAGSPLREPIAALGLSRAELLEILAPQDPQDRWQRAKQMLDGPRRVAFEAVAAALARRLFTAFDDASRRCRELLGDPPGAEPAVRRQVRHYLAHRYAHYDRYDMVLFGLQYGTDFGEGREAQVVRISPEDAVSLVEEWDASAIRGRRRLSKLAGTFLGNFGGFLERRWRESDMLWGRLDAADRIIHSLLGAAPRAHELVARAQAAIVTQTFQDLGDEQARRLFVEVAMRAPDRTDGRSQLVRALRALHPHLPPAIAARLDEAKVLDCFDRVHQERRRLDPEPALRLLSRAAGVFGRLLTGLESRNARAGRALGAYLVMGARVLWGFVEVSVPGRFFRLAADWWWKLAYAFAGALILAGLLTRTDPVRDLGIVLGIAVLGADVLRGAAGLYLGGRRRILRRILVVGAILALVALGVWGGMGIERWRVDNPGASAGAGLRGVAGAVQAWWRAMPAWGWVLAIGVPALIAGARIGYGFGARRTRIA